MSCTLANTQSHLSLLIWNLLQLTKCHSHSQTFGHTRPGWGDIFYTWLSVMHISKHLVAIALTGLKLITLGWVSLIFAKHSDTLALANWKLAPNTEETRFSVTFIIIIVFVKKNILWSFLKHRSTINVFKKRIIGHLVSLNVKILAYNIKTHYSWCFLWCRLDPLCRLLGLDSQICLRKLSKIILTFKVLNIMKKFLSKILKIVFFTTVC